MLAIENDLDVNFDFKRFNFSHQKR